MKGCRDCTRCTESKGRGCLLFPFRFLLLPFTVVRQSFMRKCPSCGHPLAWHQRDETGRFKD